MSYARVREQVSDGDLIAVRARTGWARVVSAVQHAPYTHTALAFWLDGGLWVTEMDGVKNVLVPLSQYERTPFDVFPCPVDRAAVRSVALEKLRQPIGYSWQDIATVGLHLLFGTPLPEVDSGGKICSAHSATCYLLAGWKPRVALPSIPWPAAVVAALEAPPVASHAPS